MNDDFDVADLTSANLAAGEEARRANRAEAERDRLLTAVEAAILNIQHNRFGAAVAGLRVARDLTRASRAREGEDGG